MYIRVCLNIGLAGLVEDFTGLCGDVRCRVFGLQGSGWFSGYEVSGFRVCLSLGGGGGAFFLGLQSRV